MDPEALKPPTFYDLVWEFVQRVPRGHVVTYGQIAMELGSPAAARAVGYALSNLSAETEVPWWRVINAKGGVSLRGRGANAELQRALLEHEGVTFGDDDTTHLPTYRWWPDEDDDAGPPGAD